MTGALIAFALCATTLAIQKHADMARKTGRAPSTFDRAAIVLVFVAAFVVRDVRGWDAAVLTTFVVAMLAAGAVILAWPSRARPTRRARDKASALRAPPRSAKDSTAWSTSAALLFALPIGVSGGICAARYLPIGADLRFAAGYLLTVPLCVAATCALALVRSAGRAWAFGLALSAIFGVLAFRA